MSKESRFSGLNKESEGIPDLFTRKPVGGHNSTAGIFRAKVVDSKDEHYQGSVWVELPGAQGSNYLTNKETDETRKQYRKVRMTSPMGGNMQGSDSTNSFGAAFHPPTAGTEILVGFTGGESEGYFMGAVHDTSRNNSVPGLASSEIDGEKGKIGQVADLQSTKTQEGNNRPKHPLSDKVVEQGLGIDTLRGVSSSGARRESPSNVSGFVTPGGHHITMDDGTVEYDKELVETPDRKREAGQSNLLRLRSGGGGQILINDSANMIYIISQTGNSWVQISGSGKIDIYGGDHISMHTEGDLNIQADGDLNIEAESVNMKARGGDGIKMEAASGNIDLSSNLDMRITAEQGMHLKSTNPMLQTASMIELNGPPADTAEKPEVENLVPNGSVQESIVPRVPEREPWNGHDEMSTKLPAPARSSLQSRATDYNLSPKTIPKVGAKALPHISKSADTSASANPGAASGSNPRGGSFGSG